MCCTLYKPSNNQGKVAQGQPRVDSWRKIGFLLQPALSPDLLTRFPQGSTW